MLSLSGGDVIAGKEWTDDGAVHEVHSLKRRAATATRPVPIPPQFVRILRSHIERFDVAPDGRLFRNMAGNYVGASAYGTTWARARRDVLTRTEQASRLVKRPYILRRAGAPFWLYSGVGPAGCTRRAARASRSSSATTRSSWTASGSRPIVPSSSPCRSGTASARARYLPGKCAGLVRDWSGSAGQEWDTGGRNREVRPVPAVAAPGGPSERRPTGKDQVRRLSSGPQKNPSFFGE